MYEYDPKEQASLIERAARNRKGIEENPMPYHRKRKHHYWQRILDNGQLIKVGPSPANQKLASKMGKKNKE